LQKCRLIKEKSYFRACYPNISSGCCSSSISEPGHLVQGITFNEKQKGIPFTSFILIKKKAAKDEDSPILEGKTTIMISSLVWEGTSLALASVCQEQPPTLTEAKG